MIEEGKCSSTAEDMPNPEQFELAKIDYEQLGVQEQNLMDKRAEIWPKFIAIIAIPGGYTGIVGLKGSIYLLVLVTFFLACISLDVKHDEQVLRYDVRKSRKLLAQRWKFKNHDSHYSNQDGFRWWAGYYKYGKAFAFMVAQLISSVTAFWYFFIAGHVALSITLAIADMLLTVFTAWCLL